MGRIVRLIEDEMALVAELAGELGVDLEAHPVHRVSHAAAGSELSALHWGRGSAGRLVLLHGGSLNAHSWDRMILLHRLDAVALDLPGHGHSAWFDEPLYLPEQLARVVAPVIAELADGPVTLVGHSLGGLTALALAAAFPALVDRLVLVDATPGSTPDRSRDIIQFVSVPDFGTFDEMLDHVAAFKPDRDRESLRRSVLLNAARRDDGRWSWRHDPRRLRGADRWAVLFHALPEGWAHAARVRCPVLLVRGQRSPILLDRDVQHYRDVLRQVDVVEIPGAGHNVHGDAPWELGLAMRSFRDR